MKIAVYDKELVFQFHADIPDEATPKTWIHPTKYNQGRCVFLEDYNKINKKPLDNQH